MADTEKKPMSLAAALRDFFGLRETGIKGFMEEIRGLSDGDRAEFKTMLEGEGYAIQ